MLFKMIIEEEEEHTELISMDEGTDLGVLPFVAWISLTLLKYTGVCVLPTVLHNVFLTWFM